MGSRRCPEGNTCRPHDDRHFGQRLAGFVPQTAPQAPRRLAGHPAPGRREAVMNTTTEAGWLDILFDPRDASEVWTAIFNRLSELALNTTTPTGLHQETVIPDRLLAESAW